jgi:uncharacterized GH25 family protein
MFRIVGILVFFPIAMSGHDMWVEPSTFNPAPGQMVAVKLRVGQELLGDPIARSARSMREFVVVDGEGRHTVMGREGSDPAGYVRGREAVIGYWSHPSTVELDADKFNAYLKEEGLESVLAERARRKQNGAKVREQFSRCAKSLLAGAADRQLGFPLELVAERNPHGLGTAPLPIRLIYLNRPLSGALVVAINKLNPEEKVTVRTGKAGRAHLRLAREGMWMLKAVHMVAGPGSAEADWVSYWASLTFGLGSK